MLHLKTYQKNIADCLDSSQSAISQEIARNSVDGVYDAKKAQELSDSRRIQRDKPGLDRVSLSERPEAANTREEFGHLEMDFVLSIQGSTACVLSGRERKTRYPFLIKLENKSEAVTTESIKDNLVHEWTKSFTTDNDKSFVGHSIIKLMTGVPTFFTAPSSPHEKGAVEQLNKELRVFYPKGRDFSSVTQEDLDRVVANLRTAPMKCLNWLTPEEALAKELAFDTS